MTDRASQTAFRLSLVFVIVAALALIPLEMGLLPASALVPNFFADVAVLVIATLAFFFILRREFQKRQNVEDALRATQQHQQLLLNHSAESFILTDPQGRVRDFNQLGADRIRLLSGKELRRGENLLTYSPNGAGLGQRQHIQMALTGQPVEFDYQFPPPHDVWQHITIHPVRDATGTIQELVFTSVDITELKRAEREIQTREQQLRQLFEQMLDGFALHEIICNEKGQPLDYRYLQVNAAFEQMTGLRAEAIIGKTASQVTPGKAQPIELYGRVALTGEPAHFEYEDCPRQRHFEVTVFSPQRGQFAVLMNDVTERKRAVEQLRERQERFRQVFEQGPLGVAIVDLEGRLVEVNDAFCQMVGYTPKELLGKTFAEITHPHDLQKEAENTQRLATGAISYYTLEKRYLRRNGEAVWAILTATLVRDEGGKPLYYLAMIQDRSEQQRALQELAENEERYRVISDLTSDYAYSFYIHPDGRVEREWVTGAYTRITGYTPAQVDGLGGWEKIIHPDDYARAEESLHLILQGHPSINEHRIVTRDKQIRWVREYIQPVYDPESQRVVRFYGAAQDITDRKRIEQAEREQRQLTEALRNTATLLNSTLNLEQLIERILDNVERVVPHQAASIMLLEGHIARVVGSHGYGDSEHQSAIGTVELDVREIPNLRRILASNQPHLIPDTRLDPDWVTMPATRWVRSNVCAPIRLRHEIIGFLNLDSATPNFFNDAAPSRLQAFADQAAVAIDNARLWQATRSYASQMEILYEAGLTLNRVLDPDVQIETLIRMAMQAVGAQRAEFFRVNDVERRVKFVMGVGYDAAALERARHTLDFSYEDTDRAVVRALRARQVIHLPDAQADANWVAVDPAIRSAVWVPIQQKNEMLGVLGVLALQPHAFTREAEQLLELFANQAAVALDNARLFANARRRLNELDAVNRISTALREANTKDEMATRVLEKTLAILNAKDGQIAFIDSSRRELVVHTAHGWFVQTPRTAPIDDGIAGRVLATNQPYATSNFRLDATTSELARAVIPPDYSGVIVPVRNVKEEIGVLAVAVPLPRELDSGEIALLTTIAEIAGNALARAELYAQTERRVQQLAALRAIDAAMTASTDLNLTLDILLAQSMTQLGADAGDVLTFSPHLQTLEFAAGRGFRTAVLQYTKLRLGEGYAGTAALERRLIVVPDLPGATDGLSQAPLLPSEGFVSYVALPLVAKGALQGVLELFTRTPLRPDAEWLEFAGAVASQAALTIDNAQLFRTLQQTNLELALAYDSTIEGWSRALDMRDKETEGHAQRVTELTLRLARALGVGEEEMVSLRRGALLHDIGKMGIPDSILLKPGALTPEEWAIMRRHPALAFEMLSRIPYLRSALDIPYAHHERWDGTGYPRGLKGEEIPFAARIFAVVDTWDALRSNRPYRAGWSDEQVRAYLAEQSGIAYDPRVVEAFLKLLDES